MTKLGYHASHEQFSTSQLLKWAVKAEKAGFEWISSSDHFKPWSDKQGHSGYAWSWLGAAMQATKLPFSVVSAPGQRYHPAILAQAIATLNEMFPDRLTVALGSGEAMNEKITGENWPEKSVRNERLQQCHNVMKKLLKGEEVSFDGLIKVAEAQVYTLPKKVPLLIGAAVTKETAGWMGSWADGLITVNKPHEELKKTVKAFRDGGGTGKPIYLKVALSYEITEEKAKNGAFEQWKTNIFDSSVLTELHKPDQFEEIAKFVKPDDLYKFVRISADPQKHIDWLKQDMKLGFECIILHNVNKNQDYFIDEFAKKVLPELQKKR